MFHLLRPVEKWALGRPPRAVNRDCMEGTQVSLERRSRRGGGPYPGEPHSPEASNGRLSPLPRHPPPRLLSVAVLCEGGKRATEMGSMGTVTLLPSHAPSPQAPAEECRQTSPGLCLRTCPTSPAPSGAHHFSMEAQKGWLSDSV